MLTQQQKIKREEIAREMLPMATMAQTYVVTHQTESDPKLSDDAFQTKIINFAFNIAEKFVLIAEDKQSE